jgi:hypothetical protein
MRLDATERPRLFHAQIEDYTLAYCFAISVVHHSKVGSRLTAVGPGRAKTIFDRVTTGGYRTAILASGSAR